MKKSDVVCFALALVAVASLFAINVFIPSGTANAAAMVAGSEGSAMLGETTYNPINNPDFAVSIGTAKLVDVKLVDTVSVVQAETTFTIIRHKTVVTHTYERMEKTGAL